MFKRSFDLALLILLDVVLINAAFALSYYARYELELLVPVNDAFFAPYQDYLPLQFWHTLLMLVFLGADGVYTRRHGGSWFEELYRITNATTTVGILLFAAVFFLRPTVYSRGLILETIAFTIALLSGARLVLRQAQSRLRQRGVGVARVLIIGAEEIGRTVMRTLVARADLGYQVVGFIDDEVKSDVGRFKSLGLLENVEAVLQTERVDEVIITLPSKHQPKIMRLLRACEKRGVRARVVPDLFQLSLSRIDVDDIGGIPLFGIKEPTIPRGGRLVKRALDLALTALGLLVGTPLFLLIALIIRLESPGPALFKQTRIGKDGRPFTCYKFRSMRAAAETELAQLRALNEADGPLFKIKADPRLTRFGKLLRRLSFDEWPQLLNILRGEMSLVGPRPGLPREVAEYLPWHRQRLEVMPGLTGLWQVSGRSDLTFDEMCLLDIYYIENWSVVLDLTILLRTIPRVLSGKGAY